LRNPSCGGGGNGNFRCRVDAGLWAERNWEHVSFTPHKIVRDLATKKFVVTEETVDFDSRLAHYTKTAEVLITLASASLVFVPTLHISTHRGLFAFSMTLLGICVLLAVLFMVFLIYYYEESLYFPTTYTAKRSALVNAFGFTALTCFGLAYLTIALQVARRWETIPSSQSEPLPFHKLDPAVCKCRGTAILLDPN
jgi:hypothetical protein